MSAPLNLDVQFVTELKFIWMHHGVLRYIKEMIRQHNSFFIII